MMRSIFVSLICLLVGVVSSFAHCQVPCGVYTDEMRFAMIEEDLQTIEKAMGKITELSAASKPDYATLTRWTTTKESHADNIQKIVSEYFMTQRIKPDADQYSEKLSTLHQMLISAMKCKQTVDAANVAKSRELAAKFNALYFGKASHEGHDHSDHDHDH